MTALGKKIKVRSWKPCRGLAFQCITVDMLIGSSQHLGYKHSKNILIIGASVWTTAILALMYL